MNAGQLDRRIQVLRDTGTGTNGFNEPVPDWQPLGPLLAATRRDVSDAEKAVAGHRSATLVARFVVRSTSFSRGIRRTDRLSHDGAEWEIAGIKEVPSPRRAFIEITAKTEAPG